jgi:hypothetical protein
MRGPLLVPRSAIALPSGKCPLSYPRCHFLFLLAMAFLCCFTVLSHRALAANIGEQRWLTEAYGQLPLGFEPNQGQTRMPAVFLARCRNHTVFLEPNALTFAVYPGRNPEAPVNSQFITVRFLGTNSHASMQGREILPGHSNYLIGKDPRSWRTNIPQYGRVSVGDLYPGIDLEIHGASHNLEYDFWISAGADVSHLRLRVDGAQQISLNQRGELVLQVRGGQLVQTRPYAYQEKAGVRHPVTAGYRILSDRSVVFDLGAYDPRLPLTIDPSFAYSTEFGGDLSNNVSAIAVDQTGSAYLTGGTLSLDFPLVQAIQSVKTDEFNPVENDAFVTKLNPAGNAIVYSTYLGGSQDDVGRSIAVDATGAYVSGSTTSTDFPTVNPLLSTPGSGFVAKLNAAGSALVYSTYFQGGNALAIDASQAAYVQGGISTTNTFFSKIDPTGSSIDFSTPFGDGTNNIRAIAVDTATGDIVVTGTTKSLSLPTQNAFQGTRVATSSATAFVTKFNSGATALIYSTYLGGSVDDRATALALDSTGAAYITGVSGSVDFPITSAAVEPLLAGGNMCFVTKFGTSGQFLLSTFLGGHFGSTCNGVGVDTSGNVLVAGTTLFNHPLVGTLQASDSSPQSAFVTKLAPDLSSLIYSTVVGTNSQGLALALDPSGNAYLGATAVWPGTFPIMNSPTFGTSGNNEEVAVSKIVDDTACASLNVSPTSFTFDAVGGSGTVNVSAPASCGWNAVGDSFASPAISATDTQSPFVTFTGNGSVGFSVAGVGLDQPTAVGYLLVAGRVVTITQTGLSPTPLLTITKSHSGNFTQGQQNAMYTVLVSNTANTGTTSGTVTVTESVPPQLGLVSMAGTGWTCPGTAANNCTRSDPLAGGASYPPVLVTVSVAANAPSQVSNLVTVSGGGSASASVNDLAGVIITNNPPTPVSVTPSSGSGSTQQFAFAFSDGNGAGDISSVQIDIGATLSVSGTCYLYYPRSLNEIYLASDTGVWQGPLTIASPGILQNSQCLVDAGTSSVSGPGNTLTLNLSLGFKAGFAGAKNVYMEARNALQDSGWSMLGTWTVSSGVPPPDFFLGVSAGPGSVATCVDATYIVTVTGVNGFNGTVTLGTAALPAGVTGSFNPSTVSGSGTSVLTILPTPSTSPGAVTITVTGASASLNHTAAANLTVTAGIGGGPPALISMSPINGNGSSETFSFIYSDPNGATDITAAQIDINPTLSVSGACYLYYARALNEIYLASDAGAWQGPLTLGSTGTLQNSQCAVNAGASSASASGTILTLNLVLTFKAAFDGSKNVYTEVENSTYDSGWSMQGTWTVGALAPTPDFTIGMSAGPGSVAAGGTAAYTVTITGNNGFNGTVSFGTLSLPAGVTGSFNPTTVSGSGSTTLTISATSGASPGRLTITVAGTSGSLSHNTSAWLTITGDSSAGPPTAVSVTPNTGSGSSGAFAFTFSDSNGATDISSTQMEINATLSATGACYFYYSRGSNALYLASNAGAWQGPVTVGSTGTLSNSQCAVNAGASSVTTSGNTLTLNLALTFQSGFAGAKNIYMEVRNATQDSGWSTKGAWTVTSAGPSPDFSLGMTAGPGSIVAGGSAQYTVTVTGSNGFGGTVSFGVSGLPSGVTGSFNPTTVTGSGSTTLTVITTGSASPGGFTITVTGTSGALSHQATASLTITGVSSGGPPAPASVTPNTGSGSSQTFAFAFSDPSGAIDIASAQMDIGAALSATGSCYFYYARGSNALYLATDAGAWQGPLTVGSAGTLDNSQCTVNAGTSSVSASGNTLTLSLALTFTAGFAGAKNIYMEVRNATQDSGWSVHGSWTVSSGGESASPPAPVSVTPNTGSGSPETFAFEFSDGNGAADIASAQIDISAQLSATNACYLYYSRASNALYLANNAGAWQGPVTVGGTGDLANSQCTVNTATSSVSMSGNTLTLNLALSFTGAFAGAKNIYMEVRNATVDSGWSKLGGWTVP